MVVFTTIEQSGKEIPMGAHLLQGFMGEKTVRIQSQEQTKQAEQSSSNFGSTLGKAALFGAVVLGSAYLGYRQGFFSGADELFETMKDHYQKDPSQTVYEAGSATCRTVVKNVLDMGEGIESSSEIGVGAGGVTREAGEYLQKATFLSGNGVDYDLLKAYFTAEAAKRNSLMGGELPFQAEDITKPIADAYHEAADAYHEAAGAFTVSASEMYTEVKNQMLLGLGMVTLSTSAIFLSAAKCLHAARGIM